MEDRKTRADWIKNLAENNQYKAECVLCDDSIWPTPIAKCYNDLLHLMEEGNVYGSLLQIRDLYETILKIPVLAALIYICGISKESLLNDSDLLGKWISKPLSFGDWDGLASAIINKSKSGQYSLPAYMIDCIKITRKLISKNISDQYPNILNWRNEVIGHGALQFEDSDEYQAAIIGMLSNIKKYFEGRGKCFRGGNRLYEKIVFKSGDIILRGKDVVLIPDNECLSLTLDEETVDVGAFAKMSSFLFSSFYYNKRTIKYLDYKSGKDLIKDDFELREYVSAYENTEKYREKCLSAQILRREEEQMLSLLSQPRKYIPPDSIFQQINRFIDENSCGIIMLCMERGTGKSAFSNSIDNLYHDPGSSLIEDAIIRSYSLASAELRGINDFINAINVIFTRSYNANNDFRFSGELRPEISIENEDPAAAMASVLNAYQEIYADVFRIDNLIFVLDGVDEATVNTGKILDYLPSSDLLNEGVYIICTSRFEKEETVSYFAKNHIQNLYDKSNLCIEVERYGDENKKLLSQYIRQEIPNADQTTIKTLMERSEYRMLYLKVQLALHKSGLQYNPDVNIASDYIAQLFQHYNGHASDTLRKTAAMLCLLGPVTINDYFEYISKEELTYGFIGALNDLLPLLTVRGSDYGREYMLANETYYAVFAEIFHDEIVSLIDNMKSDFSDFSRRFFHDEDDPFCEFFARRSNLSYNVNLTYKERIRLEDENDFRERTFWIVSIGRMMSYAKKYDFEEKLLTEDFVNHFLMFSDMFIINDQRRSAYQKTVAKEALQYVMNMLLILAEKKELDFEFSSALAEGSFTRLLYSVEGYPDLLNKIFNENSSVKRLKAWKNIFFVEEDFTGDEVADSYSEVGILIEHIKKQNLLDSVIDMLSSNPRHGYLPYLLYIQSFDLDDALLEKTMNLIVWSYLCGNFDSNYDEAEKWLKRIRESGHKILYPDNETITERITYCLSSKMVDISEEIENLFWGFRCINADLLEDDYEKVNEALTSNNPEIRNAALKELKICFDVANDIFEDGILPDIIGTVEQRSSFFSEMENGTAEASSSDEGAAKDQCKILENCLPLLKYVRLIYENKTTEVIEGWIECLDKCLEKHSDWDSYKKLHSIVDDLYWTVYRINEENIANGISYLSKYVEKYNTGSLLINLMPFHYKGELKNYLLPSRPAITLLDLYHRAGMREEARSLSERLSAGVTAFNNEILAKFADYDASDLLIFYFYLQACRELGYSVEKKIYFDFKRELFAVQRITETCSRYSDFSELHEIIDSVLSIYKKIGLDDTVDDSVLHKLSGILNGRIGEVDEETAKELTSIVEQIDEVRREIYG